MKEVSKGFENMWEPEAKYPLHIVGIDHEKLDIVVKDNGMGTWLGRPWLTIGIDIYSQMVWGMYLSLEPPSERSLRKTIEHGVFPKNSKRNFGTSNDWDVFGIPDIISVADGPQFQNEQFSNTISKVLGSRVQFLSAEKHGYGATTERFFGVSIGVLLEALFPRMSATWSELQVALNRYIADVYSMRSNDDASTPYSRYRDGLVQFGFPNFIPVEQEADVRLALSPATFPYLGSEHA